MTRCRARASGRRTTSRPERIVTTPRHLTAAALFLALAGCQGAAPEVTGPVDGDPAAARTLLVAQVAQGPVPTTIVGDMPGMQTAQRDRLVEDALAGGVRGLDAEFEVDAGAGSDEPRLVMVLNPARAYAPETVCRNPAALATTPGAGPLAVVAVYCRGEEPLNAVEATAGAADERASRRLLWRTAAELFPDDYAEAYGWDILPGWLNLGVGGSFGF